MKNTFIILSIFILVSCQKNIDIKVPDSETKVVIEGVIETGQYPYVIVTKNQGYFDHVDTNSLIDMLVLDAVVSVSNGVITDSLKIVPSFYTFPPYRYVGSKILGQEGGTYKLKVVLEGKTYESTTTIPYIVPLDSIKFTYKSEKDTFGFLWAYTQDPPELGNFYRIFTKTDGRDSVFIHSNFSVVDDKLTNGKYIEKAIIKGKDPARPPQEYETEENEPPYWSFFKGETVVVKFCSMDVVSYDFWKTAEQQASNNGNPFAAPTTIKTNITGNALGVWTGYAVFTDTVTINDDIIIRF